METAEAVTIIRALASGMDPETSAPLEANSLLRRRQIIVALNRALCALVQMEETERSRPGKAGRAWTREEDAEVCNELSRGMSLEQIAEQHQRSVGAIVVRLVSLGKITPQGSPANPPSATRRRESQHSVILHTAPPSPKIAH